MARTRRLEDGEIHVFDDAEVDCGTDFVVVRERVQGESVLKDIRVTVVKDIIGCIDEASVFPYEEN